MLTLTQAYVHFRYYSLPRFNPLLNPSLLRATLLTPQTTSESPINYYANDVI